MERTLPQGTPADVSGPGASDAFGVREVRLSYDLATLTTAEVLRAVWHGMYPRARRPVTQFVIATGLFFLSTSALGLIVAMAMGSDTPLIAPVFGAFATL